MYVLTASILSLPAIWGALALWYQVAGPRVLRMVGSSIWLTLTIGILVGFLYQRNALLIVAFAVAFAALLIWWNRLRPTNDRQWANDVAQLTHGTVAGNHVTLYNVRNFDWRSNTDYIQRWQTRAYDLEMLSSVDMILSYWSGPSIAHLLMSFGFDDGEQVAFSVEIRREWSEDFSEIGGFFKEFELSIIAADERDIIRVRTNVRGEDAYLFRLRMPKSAIKSLFQSYVGEANRLVHTPRFYNTLTVNCTMLVYHMMDRIVGYLPWDFRLLLSGYLPGYVYRLGGLDARYSLAELRARGRITERAQRADGSEHFSAAIRDGVPDIDLL